MMLCGLLCRRWLPKSSATVRAFRDSTLSAGRHGARVCACAGVLSLAAHLALVKGSNWSVLAAPRPSSKPSKGRRLCAETASVAVAQRNSLHMRDHPLLPPNLETHWCLCGIAAPPCAVGPAGGAMTATACPLQTQLPHSTVEASGGAAPDLRWVRRGRGSRASHATAHVEGPPALPRFCHTPERGGFPGEFAARGASSSTVCRRPTDNGRYWRRRSRWPLVCAGRACGYSWACGTPIHRALAALAALLRPSAGATSWGRSGGATTLWSCAWPTPTATAAWRWSTQRPAARA